MSRSGVAVSGPSGGQAVERVAAAPACAPAASPALGRRGTGVRRNGLGGAAPGRSPRPGRTRRRCCRRRAGRRSGAAPCAPGTRGTASCPDWPMNRTDVVRQQVGDVAGFPRARAVDVELRVERLALAAHARPSARIPAAGCRHCPCATCRRTRSGSRPAAAGSRTCASPWLAASRAVLSTMPCVWAYWPVRMLTPGSASTAGSRRRRCRKRDAFARHPVDRAASRRTDDPRSRGRPSAGRRRG